MARPNILFIISDQHRLDAAGCYGHPLVQTPRLDRLAAEGVRFTGACCQSPLCVTSRASLLTGLYPHTCRSFTAKAFPLPELPTMGSVFRAAGYVTGAFGKVHVHGETRTRDLGFDERGMRLYTYWFEDYIREVGEAAVDVYATYRKPLPRYQTSYNPTNCGIALAETQMFDHLVVDRCVDFLTRHRDEPFFLWAGLDKPHPDWTAPAAYHALYGPAAMVLPATLDEARTDMPHEWYASTRQSWAFAEDEIRHCIAAYYANISYMDAKVGELLNALDRLGLADNTLVVYTTDHGEMCFEHGMVQKQNFFEGSVRVPLIVRGPAPTLAGGVCDTPIELLDLLPTFCAAAGIAAPAELEGRSLAPALAGRPLPADRPVFAEYYVWGFPERMVRQGDWKYMHAEGRPCQLYNLRSDPLEQHNLSGRPEVAAQQRRLRALVVDGWELPDPAALAGGKAWNEMSDAQAVALVEEWRRTRRRVMF